MKTTEKITLEFYQFIGKLFYSIAAADKVVRKSEYQSLLNVVNTNWMDLEDSEDEFHEDAAFQIEIVFGWLDYNQLSADECFEEFREFYIENKVMFSKKRKQLIWKTANEIANAFSGINKSELIMLSKLKLTLEK